MTLTSIITDSSKIFGQFIVDLIYFPFWWYGRGFIAVVRWAERYLEQRLKATGLLIWLKNIFVPMYGQHDWAGVLISFITRVVQIIVRTAVMLFWFLLILALALLWLIVPIIVVYQLVFQINSFFN